MREDWVGLPIAVVAYLTDAGSIVGDVVKIVAFLCFGLYNLGRIWINQVNRHFDGDWNAYFKSFVTSIPIWVWVALAVLMVGGTILLTLT